MIFKILLRLFFFIGYCGFISAQVRLSSKTEEKLIKELNSNAHKPAYQQIYLQTDKDIYDLGDDLWFKTYHIDTHTRTLDNSSKILYVQLVNTDTEEVLASQKHEIINGISKGHIFIPRNVKEGKYHLIMQSSHSLKKDVDIITGVKSIVIKSSLWSPIISEIDFDKNVYKLEDTVNIKFNIYDRKGTPLENVKLTTKSYTETESKKHPKVFTDKLGNAELKIMPNGSSQISNIQVSLKHKKDTSFYTYRVPTEALENTLIKFYPEGGHLVGGIKNKVAFKAANSYGFPIDIDGVLYENGKSIMNIKSTHNGMGFFYLNPNPNSTYHVQVTSTLNNRKFYLPKIDKQGIVMSYINNDNTFMYFDVHQTQNFTNPDVLFIRVQMRGNVLWMAKGRMKNNFMKIKVPVNKLKQGIFEITIFDDNHVPLVERLVFLDNKNRFYIQPVNEIKDVLRSRDKVSTSFKIVDQNNKILKNYSLGLRVFHKSYEDSTYNRNILSHQYLETDIKGRIYNPGYYFDLNNKKRNKYLDLLLLTQGWRSYQWNQYNLRTTKEIRLLPKLVDNIYGKIYKLGDNNSLERTNSNLLVIIPNNVIYFPTDRNGNFNLNKDLLKEVQGRTLLLKPEKGYTIKYDNPFDNLKEVVSKDKLISLFDHVPFRKSSPIFFTDDFGFNDVNELEEVKLIGHKKFIKTDLEQIKKKNKDYVCFNNVLNCNNHSSGTPAILGAFYLTNSGTGLIYGGSSLLLNHKNNVTKKDFIIIEGFYPEKTFFQPNYDIRNDLFVPDNRKTLIWDPNLKSDENGIVNISFNASDINSTYVLEIEGIDNKGLLGFHRTEFTIYPIGIPK
ncbi:hypothetical protein SAMN04487910_0469 [Aquimarina amphilecti]|uniref:MG2 domain-containing protein n=1 Tax=Aquimarina amphilecti TaxID=1038014 RepID=A0A1H7GT73_AQUAM|nr:hypothetical protein [Aquimarina amphilecti]SEK41383.1 hypothetical protein SAMN04487910_0469 [Aquimarina amphilecti]